MDDLECLLTELDDVLGEGRMTKSTAKVSLNHSPHYAPQVSLNQAPHNVQYRRNPQEQSPTTSDSEDPAQLLDKLDMVLVDKASVLREAGLRCTQCDPRVLSGKGSWSVDADELFFRLNFGDRDQQKRALA